MSKLQVLNEVLDEKLAAVPLEISVAVKTTIAEYQGEISRLKRAVVHLRKLLDLVFKPEIKLQRLADLQQLTLTEEVIPDQSHCEQEWSPGLGPVESDTEESMWDTFNIITVENQTESDGQSHNRESESTSDYEPPSEVSPDSDNSENGNVDGVESRIPLSGLKPLKSKRGRGRPRKGTSELPDLKCDVCGKCFTAARSLKRHQLNLHSEERLTGQPKKKNCEFPDLKCDVCGKCFEKARNLQRHRQYRHSEERRHMCDTCGKCFIRKDHMTQHMKLHTEEKKHCCTECGKRFLHKSILKNHMGTHTGEAFKCDVCGKCMTTAGGLKVHQKNHTEKSHQCKECDKAYTFKGDLIKHVRIHTGEKPFQCKECGKCFSDKGSLPKHMMTHTEEKPHRCNECGKCFSLKGSLTAHMKIHTGEGVQCHLCGTHLKLKSSLKRHLRTHRRNSPNE
ncbi:zinc finger protein OZF [Salmo salar]|uniref:Zinc finger protein OZF n=1 Tax=Salmo salar TaxID=8030 RepID=A0A1S3M7S9_SALSA|nr:zinc finger protein OZF [Salmo salar]|eukprot:XP_013999242.1 PREDICTED: zinc finger protein 79 [Salmo salar]